MRPKLFKVALRLVLSVLAIAGTASPAAAGSGAAAYADVQPYRTVAPEIPEDARTVRLYFQYSCPYCRAAHRQIAHWGASLPATLEFRESPVVGATDATMIPAFGFYAMRKVAPSRLADFNDKVYAYIQDEGRSPADPRVYVAAARKVGVNERRFIEAWSSESVKNLVVEAAKLGSRYSVAATPSIAIGGRMVITPEMTGGVNDNFINLANAVTSKMLIELSEGAPR